MARFLALALPMLALADGRTSSFWRKEQPGALIPLSNILDDAAVQQHRVIGGSPDEVMITFASATPVASTVKFGEVSSDGEVYFWAVAHGQSTVTSSLNYYTPVGPDGVPIWDDAHWGTYTDPADYYTSPFIHAVKLGGLKASTTYRYFVPSSGDDVGEGQQTVGEGEKTFEFTTTPAVGPDARIRFGLMADVGQTDDSLQTMQHMFDHLNRTDDDDDKIDAIIFPGDLSYADGEGVRWDSWGVLGEFLLANVVTTYVPGNHEFGNGENFAGYMSRYPTPHERAAEGSTKLWYSHEAGPAHVINLCSYCDVKTNSSQYAWLAADLASIDRAKTPWVLAQWHSPWYNSNNYHKNDTNSMNMKADLEPLFKQYGVDMGFAGHVHSYERTNPVYGWQVAPAGQCGMVHVCIGDGGNREGAATDWYEPQPGWSSMREASFGHGTLDLINATTARWRWWRNQDGVRVSSDEVMVERCEGGGVRYA